VLTPAAVFRRRGGFDTRYAPAYFEDSDYSFRLRRMGLKTYYQPRARVVHIEGVSHGRDLASGLKSCQVANRGTFVRAWDAVLSRDHYPNGTHVMRARDRARDRKIVLVIDHLVPRPDRDAGSRTMMAFLRALLAADTVVKFWPHNGCGTPGYTEALQDMGIEVCHGPDHPSLADWLRLNGADIDRVLLSRPEIAEDCLPAIRRHTKAHVAYYGHDLHFMRLRAQAEAADDDGELRAADSMEQRERAVWSLVDTVMYPSSEEAAIVARLERSVHPVVVQPYGFERFAEPRRAPSGQEIVFVAGFGHPPNEAALRWYLAEIHPLVLARVPDATVVVVGSDPSPWVLAAASSSVTVAANVSDAELTERYEAARVAIVPLRCGAGVKLKVVEALREGVPLVTTPVGAQGLPGLERIAPVRKDPVGFAGALCALLLDDTLWERACADQIAYAQARFGERGLSESLLCGLLLTEVAPVALAAE
jgi:glycosyltransferase involved in cell wall biosynthesis